MAVILLIVLLGLGVVLAAALGSGWGPAILGLGFGGWALLVLLPGYGWPWTLFGVIYFTLAIAELFAAYGFWSWQDGSATAWRERARIRSNPRRALGGHRCPGG